MTPGRKPLLDTAQLARVKTLIERDRLSLVVIAKRFGISERSLGKFLMRERKDGA